MEVGMKDIYTWTPPWREHTLLCLRIYPSPPCCVSTPFVTHDSPKHPLGTCARGEGVLRQGGRRGRKADLTVGWQRRQRSCEKKYGIGSGMRRKEWSAFQLRDRWSIWSFWRDKDRYKRLRADFFEPLRRISKERSFREHSDKRTREEKNKTPGKLCPQWRSWEDAQIQRTPTFRNL